MSNRFSRTRVKVCGITRPKDARELVSLGVDALAVNFYAHSPRYVTIEQAQQIRAVVPAFVTLVGVFVDSSVESINRCIELVGLDLVQLHGNESADDAAMLNAPYIKAIRARSSAQIVDAINEYATAKAILLDPYVKGVHGGTGQSLDPSLWPTTDAHDNCPPLVLAGGLSPENIAPAVQQLRPFAIDLNSGVETEPGIKNTERVAAVFTELKRIAAV